MVQGGRKSSSADSGINHVASQLLNLARLSCVPPAPSPRLLPPLRRYFCNVCDIRHTGGCANAEVPDGGDERKAERKCIDCNLSKRPYSAKRANPDAAGTGGEGGASSSPPGNGGEPSQNKGKKPRRNSGSGEHEKTGTSTTPLPRLPPSPGKSGDLMRVCKWVQRGCTRSFKL